MRSGKSYSRVATSLIGALTTSLVTPRADDELLGVPGRAVMTSGSLMLTVMTITGVVLGWKRRLILTGNGVEKQRTR